MKKKIAIIVLVIFILVTIKLFFSFILNGLFILKYNNGIYSDLELGLVGIINFPQSYVVNYNKGSVLYKNGKYEEAVEKYKEALNGFIFKEDECKIRINYALSICKTVSVDEKNQDSIKKAIEKYESAVQILTERGCANKDDNNGHNKDAQQLKNDIQKEIDRLNKLLDNKDSKEDNKDDNKNDKEKDLEQKLQDIEDKIQEIKENALQDQKEVETKYQDRVFTYNKVERNW